jgi:hypothetical protein
VSQQYERHTGVQFPQSANDQVRIADDSVPTVTVGEVTEQATIVTMSAVIVAANNTTTRSRCRRKPGVSIGVFAQAMHYLDDVRRRAGWVPHLQLNFVAVIRVQYGAFVAELSHPHSSS